MERDFAPPAAGPRFEQVYLHYEFAPLVALCLAAGNWIKAQTDRKPRTLQAATRPTPARTVTAAATNQLQETLMERDPRRWARPVLPFGFAPQILPALQVAEWLTGHSQRHRRHPEAAPREILTPQSLPSSAWLPRYPRPPERKSRWQAPRG